MSEAGARGPGGVVGFLRDIKLEHSIFALPFAIFGALLVCRTQAWTGARALSCPTRRELLYLIVAMVGARTAAMGFNRVVDRHLDARNPRTAQRALAAGRSSLTVYLAGIGLGIAALYWATAHLHPLSRTLAPVALAVLFFYSFTKRFTPLCHYWLGLSLGLSPLAAWVALGGRVPHGAPIYLLATAVVLWVGGFDILYATMDLEFDREQGLRSLPAWLGVPRALAWAKRSHQAVVLCLLALALVTPGLSWGFGTTVVLSAGLLGYEHSLVTPDDLKRVNTAFFTVNALLGPLLLAGALWDLLRG